MDAPAPRSVCPGTVLGPATQYVAGLGTHIHNGEIIASLLGRVTITPAASDAAAPPPPPPSSSAAAGPQKRLTRITAPSTAAASFSSALPTISVARPGRPREALPQIGSTVVCRVVRLTPRQAIVAIHQVDDAPLRAEWQGVIRTQDVRATEKDRVRIDESFRPGDVVVARVVRTRGRIRRRRRRLFGQAMQSC
jgi:exosome complex component CSL4